MTSGLGFINQVHGIAPVHDGLGAWNSMACHASGHTGSQMATTWALALRLHRRGTELVTTLTSMAVVAQEPRATSVRQRGSGRRGVHKREETRSAMLTIAVVRCTRMASGENEGGGAVALMATIALL